MDPRTFIDEALELTVVGSFSRIGYDVRRRLFDWASHPLGSLAGSTVLVTGPTSGLGLAATDRFAELGARVILAGRSETRLHGLREVLEARHGEDRFPVMVVDMGSLGSVRTATALILATEPRLDVLVDNAGAIYPSRSEGPDGIEATLATLVIGPFALTAGLFPLLRRSDRGRIIAVTSGGMYTQRIDVDDLLTTAEPYSGPREYARSKRAQVALIREWARRSRTAGIAANAMHPGWADTPGLVEALPTFHRLMRPVLRTPSEGVDTLVWLAAADDARGLTGGLFLDRRRRPFDRVPGTRLSVDDRRRLWNAVVALSGSSDPLPER